VPGRRLFTWIWRVALALLVLFALVTAGYIQLVKFAMHD
jgi:hypothetical protein